MVIENYWAVLSSDGKRVQNVILWDGVAPWEPPNGSALCPYDPDIHPDIGLDVDVGPNWRARLPPDDVGGI